MQIGKYTDKTLEVRTYPVCTIIPKCTYVINIYITNYIISILFV